MIAKKEAEGLMNEMLSFGKKILREHGEFYPYGGMIKPDGEIVHVGAESDKSEQTDSSNLLGILQESFKELAEAQECKATAIIFNVSVELPNSNKISDAIQINLDHMDHYSAEIFFPYNIDGNGAINWGNIFAQEGAYAVFASKG